MNPRTQWLWMTFACLVFLAQALPLLQTRWVEDESWECIPAETFVKEGRIRSPTFAATDSEFQACVKPPGHTLVLAPVFRWFGVGVIQARLPSVLAGLVAVILTFVLGRHLAGPTVGALAAILVATDNFFILAARTARPEAFVTMFALLALVAWFRARDTGSVWMSCGCGAAVGAAMLFHVNGLATAAGVGLLWLVERGQRYRTSRLLGYILGIVIVIAPFFGWALSSPTRREAFVSTYSRGERVTFGEKVRSEQRRYRDFLGVANARAGVRMPVPMRAHLALLALAGVAVLVKRNRALLAVAALPMVPYLLWWLYLINKSARYFALLAPLFAIIVAAAAILLFTDSRRRLIAIVVVIIGYGLTQVAGNALFIYRFRQADYGNISAALQRNIPPEATVYGALTFWPALYDRDYVCYERTPLDYALRERKPTYFILNDRVMVHGMGWGGDDWAALRASVNQYAAEHCELVGHVSNPFYGDLDIYRRRD